MKKWRSGQTPNSGANRFDAPTERTAPRFRLDTSRSRARLAGALGWPTVALGLLAGGCAGKVAGGTADAGATPALPPSCADPELTVVFDPAYSAYIPGSTTQFQIPFGVLELTPADRVLWGADDPTKVALAPGAVDLGDTPLVANAMATVLASGDVVVVAQSGDRCGAAHLHVTETTDDDLAIGRDRYDFGVFLVRVAPGHLEKPDGGATQVPCTACHGPHPINEAYAATEETPMQVGGASDDEVAATFTMGQPLNTWEPAPPSWSQYHRWDMTPAQAHAVVVYLRSLPPAPATPIGAGDAGGG
jgi:hypothetical protein